MSARDGKRDKSVMSSKLSRGHLQLLPPSHFSTRGKTDVKIEAIHPTINTEAKLDIAVCRGTA